MRPAGRLEGKQPYTEAARIFDEELDPVSRRVGKYQTKEVKLGQWALEGLL